MRFMILVKSNEASEAGVLPDEAALAEMGRFNDEMAKAGVMLAGEGLHPSGKGTRVQIEGGKTTVVDGPFAEAKEVIGGYWLVQVASKQEALAWIERSPFRAGELELRPLYELSDFAVDPTETPGGWRDQEGRFRSDPEAGPPATDPVPRKPGTTRYVSMLMADENTEASMPPNETLMSEMGALMQEMVESGALIMGEGLKPSRESARIVCAEQRRTVIDGPFAEAKELIAGFSLIQVATKHEAIEFSRRCLEIHMRGTGIDHGRIEVRPVFEVEDFPVDPAEDPEGWRKQEQQFRYGSQ